MIDIPWFVWFAVTLYILTNCIKNLASIATSAKLLQVMDMRKGEPHEE